MTKDNAEATQSWKVKLTLTRQEMVSESISFEATLVGARGATGPAPEARSRSTVVDGTFGRIPFVRPNKYRVNLKRRKQWRS